MRRLHPRLLLNAVVFSLATGGLFLALPGQSMGNPSEPKERPHLQTGNETAPSNQRLDRQVAHQLRMLAYYSVFDNIEYRLHGYRVELLGQVVQPRLKSDAETAVEHLEGVEGVINNIEILPLSPDDDRIRLGCYRAIFMNEAMRKYAIEPVPSIHIIVKNGHVTLMGFVESEMDKQIATVQANGVHGAFSVTNKLQVEKHGQAG
jgi:osmotically-inducible protein OsmY